MCAEIVKRSLSDSPSSHSVKKPCHEITSVFGRLDNLLKYRIIWYNNYHENPLEYYNISSKFRRGIVDYLECFVGVEKCRKYIQSLANDGNIPIILIISVFSDSPMTNDESFFDSMHSIYIHQEEPDQYSWTKNIKYQEKIKGLYNDPKELFSIVSQAISLLGRENFVTGPKTIPTGAFDTSERIACIKSGSKADYFFNFLDSLTETEACPNGKQDFVTECHRIFAHEQSILRVVDEFDKTYTPQRAVYWYTRVGFLYNLTNQALRQQNIEALLLLHFFIRDLDLQLLTAMDQVKTDVWKQQANLYRGQRMSVDEIEDLKASYEMGFFYSFVSTTKNIEVARMFSGGGQIMKDEPLQPVLFHFECSTLKLTRGVANIQHLSDNEAEEEILFSPLYSFSVRHVDYDENERVWNITCRMNGDESTLPLLLHQRLIKLDIAVRVLLTSIPNTSNDDKNGEICQTFIEGMSMLLNKLVITEGNIVTLDENAEVQKNTRHAVTALFLLKSLKNFNNDSLAHKPHIPTDTMVALWDCLGMICKENGDFQRALLYFEKAEACGTDNLSIFVARKINIAQVNRMMGLNAQTWSIYRELLNEYVKFPDEDNFNVFSDIATDMPFVETEKSMEIWYPNILSYLEYVYTQCQEIPEDKVLFRCELKERYQALGRAYWYLVYDKQHALYCYNRWKELVDENDEPLGEPLMYLAHTHFLDDSLKAKSLYEQAIVELTITEEVSFAELAVCYCRLGYLQKRKRFFIRCFYLLTFVGNLSALLRENLEETGECYFYLAKSYTPEETIINKATAQQLCRQALRLFLNVKPPTSNFRDMQDCVEFLLSLQEENDKTMNKNELLQTIYNETSITEEQLEKMLHETRNILNNMDIEIESMTEESNSHSSE